MSEEELEHESSGSIRCRIHRRKRINKSSRLETFFYSACAKVIGFLFSFFFFSLFVHGILKKEEGKEVDIGLDC